MFAVMFGQVRLKSTLTRVPKVPGIPHGWSRSADVGKSSLCLGSWYVVPLARGESKSAARARISMRSGRKPAPASYTPLTPPKIFRFYGPVLVAVIVHSRQR